MQQIPRLHVVTPPTVDHRVVEQATTALAAGAPLLQVRTKGVGDRVRHAHTAALAVAGRAAGAAVVVNDRVDLALAVGADGVHVGADDLPPAVVRGLLGPDAVVGATARDPEGARRAVDAGVTYLGVGPVYPTATKTGLPDPMGPASVEAVASAVDVPVIAIAGVTAARVPELLDAGAWGVAVVGCVFGADDPGAATAELVELLQ